MAWHFPDDPGILANTPHGDLMRGTHNAHEILKFAKLYMRLDFGWIFARGMTEAGRQLPPLFGFGDSAVHRAYWYNRGHKDPFVDTALAIHECDAMRSPKRHIQCQIIANRGTPLDRTMRVVGEKLGIHPKALLIYEKLFFNVVDRWHDEKFLNTLLYPDTKVVETDPSYMIMAPLEQVLLRVAGSNSRDMEYFLGGNGVFNSKDGAREYAEGMEAALMSNGLVLARNGWAGAQSAVALHHARQLLSAAKAGGQVDDGEATMREAGDILMAESLRLQSRQMLQ